MKRSIESFYPDEFGRLDRDRTVFVFPMGGIESRGPHLKLCYSLSTSRALSERFADLLDLELKGDQTIVLYSSLPTIVDSQSQSIAIRVRPYVLRDWLVDTCVSLHELGFKHFLALSTNLTPKQLTAIEEAEKLIRRRTGSTLLSEIFKKNPGKTRFLSLSSSWVPREDQLKSLFFPNAKDHGGERETAWALALDANEVRPGVIPPLKFERQDDFKKALRSRLKKEMPDTVGNPLQATPESGARQIDAILHQSARHAADFLKGIPQGSRFRTWYSVIPTNKSFFKGWVLSISIFILFCAFVAMSF